MPIDPVIQLEKVFAGYGANDVLEDVTMEVSAGDFIGILGPNGSGKSTLLRVLTRILPVRKGMFRLFGQDAAAYSNRQLARKIAVIPQHTRITFPILGIEIVIMGRYPYKKGVFSSYSKADYAMALSALEALDATHLAGRNADTLSGGETSLLAIGRAIAQAPHVLLADEATASLDLSKKLQVFELLTNMNRVHGLTVVSVMHDINLASLYCKHLMFLKDGRIVFHGPVEDVLTSENLKSIYNVEVEVVKHPTRYKPQVLMK